VTEDLVAEDYTWEIGQISSSMYFVPYKITYVIGRPN
jgi:hypothetical protein